MAGSQATGALLRWQQAFLHVNALKVRFPPPPEAFSTTVLPLLNSGLKIPLTLLGIEHFLKIPLSQPSEAGLCLIATGFDWHLRGSCASLVHIMAYQEEKMTGLKPKIRGRVKCLRGHLVFTALDSVVVRWVRGTLSGNIRWPSQPGNQRAGGLSVCLEPWMACSQ